MIPSKLAAQFSLNAENMALGGGGTAYVTGYEAIHINPANLYFQEKPYKVQYSFLQFSGYFDSLLPIPDNSKRLHRFFNVQKWEGDPVPIRTLPDDLREDLINRSFNENQSKAEFLNRADIYWMGIKWVGDQRSYAIAVRTRLANRFSVGRGLFSNFPLDRNSTFLREQSLSHSSQALHEISFGVAESFTYLNGLTPHLSEFSFGIAPKIVVAGSYLNVDFDNRFNFDSENGLWVANQSYRQTATGEFTSRSQELAQPGGITDLRLTEPTLPDLFKPKGFGLGLDIGVTYLLTLGDDFSVIRDQGTPTIKSLRIGLSVTDLGASFYNNDAVITSADNDSLLTPDSPNTSRYLYEGSANEHYRFLSQFSEFNNLNFDFKSQNRFGVLLPTSIQAGAVFHYNRIKAVGDISYAVTESAFNPTGVIAHLGLEVRPLGFLPLRAGTRLAPKLPGYYSFGTGIEQDAFDISVGLILKSSSGGVSGEILGASLISFKLYLDNQD